MSVRKKYDERCKRCLMRFELCLCNDIPTLSIASKVIIIINKREIRVPTNTGRLASLALPNSKILIHGVQDEPYNLEEYLSNSTNLLLYPSEEAQLLTPEFVGTLKKPITLVVPDGNWRQTSKMRKRNPAMAQLPIVKIAPGPLSEYKVRKESKAQGLATIEAIARALGVIESADVQKSLEDLMKKMVDRTLASRGL